MTNRCLYHAAFKEFLSSGTLEVLGTLHDHFHGEAQTTTGEAWKREIQLLQQVLTWLCWVHCLQVARKVLVMKSYSKAVNIKCM